MGAPYYVGDNVPLRFLVLDDNDAVIPTQASVIVYKPRLAATESVEATISGNEVSYLVPTDVTTKPGKYIAFFFLTIPDIGERTHRIEFKVLNNPS